MQIVVVGQPNRIRSSSLQKRIPSWNVRFSPSLFFSDIEAAAEVDQVANEELLGRRLSRGEVGCLLAHSRAWANIDEEWALILEDDADVERLDLDFLKESIKSLESRTPTVVSLFDSQDRHHPAKANLKRLRYQPSGTVGYMVNKAAREAKPHDLIGTADWPLHTSGFRFYSLWNGSVREEVNESLIGSDVRAVASSTVHYLATFSRTLRIAKRFGWAGVRVALLSPLLRDFHNALRKSRINSA